MDNACFMVGKRFGWPLGTGIERGSAGDWRSVGGLLEVCWRMLEDAGGCWKSLQLEQVVCLLSCQRRKPGISVFLELVIH